MMHSRILSNGLTVIVLENRSTPIVSIELDVKNGSYTEDPEFNGLSHLYEHMFFKANQSIPSQERYMARIRELGAEFNGTTSSERVNYFITLHSSNLREGIRFMSDALRTPRFDQAELERERMVVNAEYDRLESMPSFHLQRAVGVRLWGEAYSRKNPIGDRRVIETCTREKLQTIQARYYVPNNTALILSGDLDAEDGIQAAAETFSDWPRGEDPFAVHPAPFPAPLAESRAAVVIQPVKTVSIRLAWHGPSLGLDPGGTHAADLLTSILDQPSSGFHRALVDSGLCAAADLGYLSQSFVGPVTLRLETSADRVFDAISTALAEIEKLGPGSFSDQEIANAKSRIAVRKVFEREDPLSFANTIGFWWATAGLDYYRNYVTAMNAVTRESMELFSTRYLLGRPLVAAVLINAEEAASHGVTEERVLLAVNGQRRPVRTNRPKPELIDLDGLLLIHKHVPGAEVGAVQLYIQGGSRNIGPSDAGIERLMLETARKGGAKYNRATIEGFTSRTGSAIRTTAARDFSRISVYGASRHLEEGLNILLDVATAPAFVPAELERVRSRLLTETRHKLADPQSLLGRASMEQFYRDAPYSIDPDGTLESLARFSAEALREHHRKVFRRPALVCVAVGGMSADWLCARLDEGLAEIPRDLTRALDPLPSPAGATGAQILTITREQPTNHVMALFTGPGVSDPEYPAFYAALDYLNHRLFEEVRTRRNLAYAVSAGAGGLISNHGRILVISVDPQKSFEVIASEIERLRSELIDSRSLADTLSQLRTGILMGRTRLAGQADELGRAHIAGGHFSLAETFADRVAAVTPERVQSVFRKNLRAFNVVLIGNPNSVDREFFLSMGHTLE